MGLKRPEKPSMVSRKVAKPAPEADKPKRVSVDEMLANVAKVAASKKSQLEIEASEAQDKSPPKKVATKTATKAAAKPKTVKKKAKQAEPKKLTRANIIKIKDNDAYQMALITSMNGSVGDNMILPKDGKNFTHVVMPIPLVLQIAIETNGIPYSSVIELAGDKGSNKTALMLELAAIVNGQRYFAEDYSGFMDYLSVETKFPDKMWRAICGYPDELAVYRPGKMVSSWIHKGNSMDSWMEKGMERGKHYAKMADPDRAIPYILGIDSVAAKLLDDTMDKIEAEGVPQRQFSMEAQSIKRWVGTYQNLMGEWPFILAVINHVARDPIPRTQNMSRHKPGGRYLGYAESIDLDMAAAGKTTRRRAPEGAPVPFIATNKIKITVAKNSLGETHRSFYAYVEWHYEYPGPQFYKPQDQRQRMRWLWGKSLVESINTYAEYCKWDAGVKNALRDICHVEPVVKSADLWRCRQMKHTEHGIPAEDLGRMIELDPVMRHGLQVFHGVTQYDVFEPFTNYASQLQVQMSKKAKADRDSDNE